MNIPSFAKRKTDKNQKKNNKEHRMHTEAAYPLVDRRQQPNQSSKNVKREEQQDRSQKTYKMERMHTNTAVDDSAVTVLKAAKTTLYIKQTVKTLWQLRQYLQRQYDSLLNGQITARQYEQLNLLLSTNYFRFRKATYYSVLNQYSNVIQGLQLLISKLTNNEKLSQKVLIRNEQDFVLFFKFFFSKPYTLINLPAVRKIIKLLWDQFLFSSLTVNAIIANLRLWIFGIAAPLNPSMNKLHKITTEKSQEITKFVTHKSNSHVYIGVNDSDTLCLTPLMVATIARNIKAVEKLIKNGADLYCSPLTLNTKAVTQSIQETKFGNKLMIKKEYGYKDRRQPNAIEYLRQNKRMDEIAQILCWQNFYSLKKLRKDTEVSDILEMFPNCSFQIDWKQYRGMLCFKQLPHDIITVSKRDHRIRVDFHVKDLTASIKSKGYYSLILTAEPKQQCKLLMISHGEKKIINVLEQKDILAIKQKYTTIMKNGNIYNPEISGFKTIYSPDEKRLSSTYELYYQNVNLKNCMVPRFKNQKEYFQAVLESDLIDYARLEKDQIKAIISQSVVKGHKQKNKFVESVCSVDIQWSSQDLNLTHLELVLRLAMLSVPQSLFLAKVQKILKTFEDPVFSRFDFRKQLPMRWKWSVEGEINIQAEIKNLYYCKLDEAIFGLQIRAKEMNFEEGQQRVELSHLQDTVFMDEMYSISASRFMGKSELLLEQEQEEANKKFEQLLKLEGIWSNDEQEDH